jgi:hydrogenase expression/formation protein HypD
MTQTPYSSRELVAELGGALQAAAVGLPAVKIMHVCGTHEHEIGRYALRQLLPGNVRLIAGPGCPVCITPAAAIATAIKLATLSPTPIMCAYGDIVRVPTPAGSLGEAKTRGADLRLVYGPRDALRIAREHPDRQVVFFSVGFETTAAPVASLITAGLPENLSLYCCHRYVPAAVEVLAADEQNEVAGFLLPGHAAVISGAAAYDFLPARFGQPAAVAGFEPVDILAALVSIVRQIKSGAPSVANCYPRAVSAQGNTKAQAALAEAFDRTDADWRGIGSLPRTGFGLREKYLRWDALARFGVDAEAAEDLMPGCSCHLIMLGRKEPEDCPLFRKACTPESPRGPCMVGGEGTCRARYLYPDSHESENIHD